MELNDKFHKDVKHTFEGILKKKNRYHHKRSAEISWHGAFAFTSKLIKYTIQQLQ